MRNLVLIDVLKETANLERLGAREAHKFPIVPHNELWYVESWIVREIVVGAARDVIFGALISDEFFPHLRMIVNNTTFPSIQYLPIWVFPGERIRAHFTSGIAGESVQVIFSGKIYERRK